MLDKFFEGIGTKLADRWGEVSGPALAYWFAAALLWTLGHGGFAGLRSRLQSLSNDGPITQIVAVVGCLVVVSGSVIVVEWTTKFVTSWLGGSWPRWAERQRVRRVAQVARHVEKLDAEWQSVMQRARESTPPNSTDELRSIELDRQLHEYPSRVHQLMPTRLGNILRSSESRIFERYGLENSVVWPRLWLVLPDSAKVELSAAWSSMGTASSVMVWSVLLLPLAYVSPFAILATAVGLLAAWVWLPDRARTFAGLLEASFDVYRTDLYLAIRWPLPSTVQDEPEIGRRLTEFLFRGTAASPVWLTRPHERDHG